jgi:hypothetical protein
MMTKEFLAEFERRVLNGARAYALSRQHRRTEASVWFWFLMNYPGIRAAVHDIGV